MTMRITPQMVDNSTLATIDNDLNQLDNVQESLSTGYRINQPSDDPYGESQTLALSGQISAYSSYQANINTGVAWAQSASASLSSIQNVLNSVQELTTEAGNGTMNQNDLDDAAAEVLQYIGQVKQTADAQYDGSYIFAGTATSTAPWQEDPDASDAFAGNSDPINLTIGPSTTIPVNADLSTVLGSGSGDGGLLSTMRAIYSDMTSGNQADLGNQLTALQSNLSSLEQVQAQVGAVQDRLTMASTRISALQTTDTTQLGTIEDTDVAQATLQYSTEQAGYQAALQSTAQIVQQSLLNFLQS